MIRGLIYTILTLALFACGTKRLDTEKEFNQTEELIVNILYARDMSGGGTEGIEQGLIEITDIVQYKELRKKVQGTSPSAPPQLEFDHENFRYFFYADKVRPRLDYKVEISAAGRNEDMQTIHFLFTSIKPDRPSGERLSQPYLIFSIKKCDGDVKFTSIEPTR